ncbi:MAG: leucine-rich repeat domain-containing protein [Clostridia bacterium]|nr:leucine-rich repeat domain-containing protein [Clostridia bacterium]
MKMNNQADFETENGVLIKYHGKDTDIRIPEGITAIGAWAFAHAEHLIHVQIPEGVTEIRNGAFWGCTALREIAPPSTLKTIGKAAFGNVEGLRDENGFIIFGGVYMVTKSRPKAEA